MKTAALDPRLGCTEERVYFVNGVGGGASNVVEWHWWDGESLVRCGRRLDERELQRGWHGGSQGAEREESWSEQRLRRMSNVGKAWATRSAGSQWCNGVHLAWRVAEAWRAAER